MTPTDKPIDALIEHHRAQCSRRINGQCNTRECLIRGGWKIGMLPVDFNLAKCIEWETADALERSRDASLRAERYEKVLRKLSDACAAYRHAHDFHGDGSRREGWYWDQMRKAAERARGRGIAYLYVRIDQALQETSPETESAIKDTE